MRRSVNPRLLICRRYLCRAFLVWRKIAQRFCGLLFLLMAMEAGAQDITKNFTDVTPPELPALRQAMAAWGDYDRDGDPDLLLSGKAAYADEAAPYQAWLFQNDSGSFRAVTLPGLQGLGRGLLCWTDIDNNNYPDILMSGSNRTLIYLNRGRAGFTLLENSGLPGTQNSISAAGDIDNDGDTDLVMTGIGGNTESGIFLNNGQGIFSPLPQFAQMTAADKAAASNGAVALGDMDRDGDLDIYIGGVVGFNEFNPKIYEVYGGAIYINNGDLSFTRWGSYQNAAAGDAAWADADGDGYPELALIACNGYLGFDGFFSLERNQKGQLQPWVSSLGFASGSLDWGDADNDGDPDLLLSGRLPSPHQAAIGLNQSDMAAFPLWPLTGEGRMGSSRAVWGDYDKDGDLDILLAGNDTIKLLRNNISRIATGPAPPQALSAVVAGSQVVLQWKPGDNSPISYNVRVGQMPGDSHILSPLADSLSGTRLVTGRGNAGSSTTLPLTDLPEGTYYWTVQAISHAYRASAFAPEGVFTIAKKKLQISDFSPGHGAAGTQVIIKGSELWKVNRVKFNRSQAGFYLEGRNSLVATVPPDATTGRISLFSDSDTVSSSSFFVVTPPPFMPQPNSGLPGKAFSTLQWCDYDRDGDLDLLAAGDGLAEIYTNRSGRFYREMGNSFPGLYYASAAWGDADNDGDADLVLAGRHALTQRPFTRLYINKSYYFTESSQVFPEVENAGLAWGDVDNDGDSDLLISGEQENHRAITAVFINNGNGQFSQNTSASLPGLHHTAVAWGDYDNDGDLDLLLSGYLDMSSYKQSGIFINEGQGSFAMGKVISLAPLAGGGADWGDYDGDGDLDLALSGLNYQQQTVTSIYRNDAGTFREISIPPEAAITGALRWADIDNDGDLDLVISGYRYEQEQNGPVAAGRWLVNEGAGHFYLSNQQGTYFPGGRIHAALAPADYDNDRDLDLLFSNEEGLFLLQNHALRKNSPPQPPSGLKAVLEGDKVRLQWNAAGDRQSLNLSYNVRLGRNPRAIHVLSPLAMLNTGYHSLAAMGNAQSRFFIDLRDLPPGRYYWTVQAIDNAFAASSFAREVFFVVPARAAVSAAKQLTVYPNPSSGRIHISWYMPAEEEVDLQVFNPLGEMIFTKRYKGSLYEELELGNKAAGIYIVRLVTPNYVLTERIMLQ